MKVEKAYPGIAFRRKSRNWWARLARMPAECVHLQEDSKWMATFIPDTLYLKGKPMARRKPSRPEASLCRDCLLGELEQELRQFRGRVLGFEPDAAEFSQYFFVGREEFIQAGLEPTVAAAIARRLGEPFGDCERCDQGATWLWITREQVPSLDDAARIAMARAETLCPVHGAQRLCETFRGIEEANIFYINVPHGDAGAYLWI